MEDLPLGRTVTLVPEFAVKDLPFGRTAALLQRKTLPWAEHSDGDILVFNFVFYIMLFSMRFLYII